MNIKIVLVICLFILSLSLINSSAAANTANTYVISKTSHNNLTNIYSAKSVLHPNKISKVKYWAYKLQNINKPGAVNRIVKSRYDMVVLEPTRTDWSSEDKYFNTRSMVNSIKNSWASDRVHRKLVIAYLDIGEAENWRWYWKWSKNWNNRQSKPKDWPSYILKPDPDGWGGDFPVAYWNSTWKNIIIQGKNLNSHPYGNYRSCMDEIVKDGFDGVYLDWVEGYDDSSVIAEAKKQRKYPQLEMVKFIKEIKNYSRSKNPNFIIIQQNGADLALNHPKLLSQVDAISQEGIWYDGSPSDTWYNPNSYDRANSPQLTREYLRLLSIYKKAGKPVFDCEYAVKKAPYAYKKSRFNGFVPYCTRTSLSQLAPPSYPMVKVTTKFRASSYSLVTSAGYPTANSAYQFKLVPPFRGVYHSAFPDFGGSEDRVTDQRIDSFQKIAGKKIVWACLSDNWGTSKIKFPSNSVKILEKNNIIPYIRLMPRTSLDEGVKEKNYTLQRIICGVFDHRLIKWAKEAKATKKPLMIDFGCEMNGDWFQWSGVKNGGKITNHYGNPKLVDGPERYRDAYHHIINLFRKVGANNVNWVFHVDAYSYPNEPWNQMARYYPGDSYIDWIGVSSYGALLPGDDWISFTSVMDHAYPQLAKISKRKPLAVLEFGVTEYMHNKYKKSSWIHNALQSIKNGRYPRIKAISYWHENWENGDGTKSFLRLDSTKITMNTYRKDISNPYFITRPIFK